MRLRRIGWLIAVLVVATPLGVLCARSIESHTREILNAADLLETKTSLYVVDVSTGQELVALSPDQAMIPASNMKLITTAAAAHILGPDFAFRTELRLVRPADWDSSTTAATSDGLPSGARDEPMLIVVGDGDPGFFDPDLMAEHGHDIDALLDAWVAAVRESGVERFNHLIIDDRVFDQQLVHPTWPRDQLQNHYCAPVSGLNFYGNCLDVYVQPTRAGQSPIVRIYPDSPFLSTTTRATTGSTDTFWVSRKPMSNELTFWGTVKHQRSSPVRVTVDDPAAYFARLLAHRLADAGVTVASIDRPTPDDQFPKGQVLYRVQTTLPAVLKRCNKDSHNLAAESLLKRMGRKVTGSAGSWKSGAAAVRLFLTQPLGARSAAVTVADGSGLSRDNRVTARLIVDLLRQMYYDERIGPMFHQSLAVGGVDGTLRKRFSGPLKRQVYAKTGYIRGVSNISGYLVIEPEPRDVGQDADARPRVLAFSFLFNDIKPPVYVHQIKGLQDRVLKFLANEVAKRSQAALNTQEAVLP